MVWFVFFAGFVVGFFLCALLTVAREEVRDWQEGAGWPPE